jgi:hypothetical protein
MHTFNIFFYRAKDFAYLFFKESEARCQFKNWYMQKASPPKKVRKGQHQQRPGIEKKMEPQPVFDYPQIQGNDKLKNKVAVITGGDSGIGRAVSILFAKEGADIVIAYLNENKDAG